MMLTDFTRRRAASEKPAHANAFTRLRGRDVTRSPIPHATSHASLCQPRVRDFSVPDLAHIGSAFHEPKRKR